jgi:hypothetical protein
MGVTATAVTHPARCIGTWPSISAYGVPHLPGIRVDADAEAGRRWMMAGK